MAQTTSTVTPTKLKVEQRKILLGLGATNDDIGIYCDEGYSFAEMQELCEAAQGAKDTELQGAADRNALATKHALQPESKAAPMISVYHPNGIAGAVAPKFKMNVNGSDGIFSDDEVALMNQIRPGTYMCLKTDGSKVKVLADAKLNSDGAIVELMIGFPCAGHDKNQHFPLTHIFREMIAQTPAPIDKPLVLMATGPGL